MPNPREIQKQRQAELAAAAASEGAAAPQSAEVTTDAASESVGKTPASECVDEGVANESVGETDASLCEASDAVSPAGVAGESVGEPSASDSVGNIAASGFVEEPSASECVGETDVERANASETVSPADSDADTAADCDAPDTSDKKARPSARKGKADNKECRKDEEKIKAAKRQNRNRIIKRTFILLLIAALVLVVGGFVFVRWYMQDDAAKLVGTWKIQGSEGTVQITDTKIILNDEVSYEYEIDPMSKTLNFKFGTLDGNARYRFAVDGNKLSILDGKYDFTSTLAEDLPWVLGAVVNPGAYPPTLGSSSMLLERVG